MPARWSNRIWRSTSVMPPNSTRHLGDSPAVPFSREPLPAARMIPRIPRVLVSGGREPPSTDELEDLGRIQRAVVPSDRHHEEERQVEHAPSNCLYRDSQKRAG